jgi:sphinganine-1-phosphate aldolase
LSTKDKTKKMTSLTSSALANSPRFLTFILLASLYRHNGLPTPVTKLFPNYLTNTNTNPVDFLLMVRDFILNNPILQSKPVLRGVLGDILGLFLARQVLKFLVQTYRLLSFQKSTSRFIFEFIANRIISLAQTIPGIKSLADEEFKKTEDKLEHELKHSLAHEEKHYNLPSNGWSADKILTKMNDLRTPELPRWQNGYVSGAVYNGRDDMITLQNEAMKLFTVTNPLHADLWPSVTKFEAECVSMAANLVNGGNSSVCGTMTSGGTESIIMAVKTHREWARAVKHITEPEIVAPDNAHAAIDKACEILGIKLIHAPVNPKTRKADVDSIRARMSPDTIMIYSSAPSFPHGIIDPIKDLSDLAIEYGVGLHVDCCLGGFVLPFANMLGHEYSVDEKFDFELPGVTSMSMDTHKFGYAAKGTSIVLYRDHNLRHYQYFCYPKWPGGLYTTPSTPGSRPGALIAAAWAAMMNMGTSGYMQATKEILDAVKLITTKIKLEVPGIHVIGDPHAMIVGFASEELDIYVIVQHMTKKGWSLNNLQHPPSAHLCVTLPVSKHVDRFIQDLKQCAEIVKAQGGKVAKGETAPVYGTAAAMPSGPMIQVLHTFNDVVLKV